MAQFRPINQLGVLCLALPTVVARRSLATVVASPLRPPRVARSRSSCGPYTQGVAALDFPKNRDERLVPNLPRGRGRSIGGDLNIGEEGFEQTIITVMSVHMSWPHQEG
jgi:hypothetical protein